MTGMFKGLARFNLDDYNKVQSRVTSDHLAFFVKQYCENAAARLPRRRGKTLLVQAFGEARRAG